MSDSKQITWPEFRSKVFDEAMNIVENSNCSSFKIIGYKYLDIRLILYFDDCNQVFDFDKKGEDGYTVTSFFTNDKTHEEHMEERSKFKEESERDIPEKK